MFKNPPKITNNKHLKRSAFSFVILTTIFFACKKYPDGPIYTIEPKIFRFTSEWNLDKGFINGVDQTDSIKTTYPFYHLTVERKKSYTISWTTAFYSVEYYEHGTWEWVDNKKSIHFKYEGNGSTGLYGTHAAYPTYPGEYTIRILRLKEKSCGINGR